MLTLYKIKIGKLHIDIFCKLCYFLNRKVRIKFENEGDLIKEGFLKVL
jgi:hypothetical protein